LEVRAFASLQAGPAIRCSFLPSLSIPSARKKAAASIRLILEGRIFVASAKPLFYKAVIPYTLGKALSTQVK
jgi:hypothetical protein